MTGRIREILFDDGVNASGTVIEAASQAYVDAKFDPVEPSSKGIWLDNTSGLPTLSPWRAGVLAWDTEHDCLAVSTIFDGSWVQVAQESQDNFYNDTGAQLTNGTVVYIDGAHGHRPEIKKASCTDESVAKKTIGLVTANIDDKNEGPVCLSGQLHGINTNSYNVGDVLWLNTTAGTFTNTLPSYQYEHIMIGIVLEKSPTDGVIYVSVKDLTDQVAKMGFHIVDPHGFTEYDNTYMTRSWVGNTFTLTQVGTSTPYYCKGKLKYLTGNKSITLTPTAGAHLIGLNCTTEVLEDLGGTIPAASVVSTHILCEFAYANGTDVIYNANERHSTKFPKRIWFYNHLYLSTQYRSGIQPSITSIDGNGSSLDHARWSVTTGIISDEDIDITVAALASAAAKTIWYYNGTVWVKVSETNGTGVIVSGSGRASYNNYSTGLVEATNNYHVLTHLFAANDGTVIAVIGNSEYQLLSAARIAASTEIATLLTTGLPFPEFRAIATFINQTSNTYSNAVKSKIVSVDTGVPFIDWRKTALNPVAGQSASNHQNLAGLQGGQAGEYYHLTAAQQTNIVNNVFPSGTSTNTTNKILLPTNTTAGWNALTATESLIGWDSTKKKPVVGTGSAIVPIGGGLTPVSLSLSDFTGSPKKYAAESGKLYLVDMASAAEQYTITAPDGAAEVVFAVQCKNNENTTYLLAVEGFGGTDQFYYDDTAQTPLYFSYPEMRVDFAWDSNDSHFLCAVSQTPVSGTWSGVQGFASGLKTDTIDEYTSTKGVTIKGKTDGSSSLTGYIGQVIPGTITNAVPIGTSDTTISSEITLSAGQWDVYVIAPIELTCPAASNGVSSIVLRLMYGAGNTQEGRTVTMATYAVGTSATIVRQALTIIANVNFSGSDRVYRVRAARGDLNGTGSAITIGSDNGQGIFYAIRRA